MEVITDSTLIQVTTAQLNSHGSSSKKCDPLAFKTIKIITKSLNKRYHSALCLFECYYSQWKMTRTLTKWRNPRWKERKICFVPYNKKWHKFHCSFQEGNGPCKKFTLVERPSSLSIYFPRCILPYCLIDVSDVILEPFWLSSCWTLDCNNQQSVQFKF